MFKICQANFWLFWENSNSMEYTIPKGIVLGLVGPPGIGKGYITRQLRSTGQEIGFIYKVTTREPRNVDLEEGVRSGLGHEFFSDQNNLIIAEHRPFNDERRYGWLLNGVEKETAGGKSFVFDPNVEFLDVFKKQLGQKLHLVGLMADETYIRQNLLMRANNDLKMLSDIETRVSMGRNYMNEMAAAYSSGLIDKLIFFGESNRSRAFELVTSLSWEIYNSKEGYKSSVERR